MKKIVAALLLMVCQIGLAAAQIEIIEADSTWNATTSASAGLEQTVADDEQTRVYTDYADSLDYTNYIYIPSILEDWLSIANPRIKAENPNSIATILTIPFPIPIELVLRPILRSAQSQELRQLEFDNSLCIPLNDTRVPEITNITVTIVE